MFLASNKGRRLLNFMYSWGAAVVILGALFKLLHLPMGNEMLFIGMITEFFVFFISGFEKPAAEYHWEEVFPELDSKNPMDRAEMEARRVYLQEKAAQARDRADGTTSPHSSQATAIGSSPSFVATGTSAATTTAPFQVDPALAALVPEDQLQRLSDSIGKLSEASEQLARIGTMAAQMTNTYQDLQSHQEGIKLNSQSYMQQMENLSRNISGLNTIYEIQLKGISSQIDSIERINRGLTHIRDMYDNTVVDSTSFRNENERMAKQLGQLNDVYARLLHAMTVNMGMPGNYSGYHNPQPQTQASAPQNNNINNPSI